MENIIKTVIAVLFLICLLDMPYGYFQLVRIVAMIGFVLLAHAAYEKNQSIAVIVYIGLAILFQPMIKIALGRAIWNVVDVIVAVALLLSIFLTPTIKPEK